MVTFCKLIDTTHIISEMQLDRKINHYQTNNSFPRFENDLYRDKSEEIISLNQIISDNPSSDFETTMSDYIRSSQLFNKNIADIADKAKECVILLDKLLNQEIEKSRINIKTSEIRISEKYTESFQTPLSVLVNESVFPH